MRAYAPTTQDSTVILPTCDECERETPDVEYRYCGGRRFRFVCKPCHQVLHVPEAEDYPEQEQD